MLRVEGSGLATKVVHEEPVLGVNVVVPSRREAQAAVKWLQDNVEVSRDDPTSAQFINTIDILHRFVETR